MRAERDAVMLRSGVTIMDTRASPGVAGSIAELLRTVPGIELDADGRLSMRNSTSVLVLMNGRRTPLTGEALVAFLRQMPASALERIETGTAPSARQDANGAAGVVNLVFRSLDDPERRTAVRSLSGTFASADHFMASAAATGRMRDLLHWDAMYSLSGMQPRTTWETARWSVVPGDLPFRTAERAGTQASHRLHSIVAGTAVTPTPRSSLALRGAYSWMKGAYRNRSAFEFTDEAGNSAASTTGSLLEHEIPTAELTALASFDGARMRFASEARTSLVNGDYRGHFRDLGADFGYLTTAMASRQREHVLRNDLKVRLPGIDVDVGHESRLRSGTATHDADHFGATESQAFRHETEVHAGYVAAHRSTGNLRAEAGLRVEADRTHLELDAASAREAVRLFPNVSAEWTDARRALVYRFGYGRRISRPGPEMLNPFPMGADDMNEIIGNPSLQPEISDQVELGVERHGSRSTLQLTPFHRFTRDPIRPLKAPTARGGTTTTLTNLSWTRATGADVGLRTRPTDGTVVTLAGSIFHVQTTAAGFSRNGTHASARLSVDVRVAENTTAQLYASRRSAQAIEQGEILPAFNSDLALTQRVARGRGLVTLRLNDPWGSDRLAFQVADPSFSQETRRRTARPSLSLFASFAVGGAPREDAPRRPQGPARIF